MDLEEAREELARLPLGYISHKQIRGRVYPYHQWSQGGKKMSRYVPPEELEGLEQQLKRRRELKELLRAAAVRPPAKLLALFGDGLQDAVQGVSGLPVRQCYELLEAYLNDPGYDRVCILFGLRGSGKSTLMRQAIAHLSQFQKCVYIKVRQQDTMELLTQTVGRMQRHGFRYFFLDDVSQLPEFIDGAGALAEYTAAGAKIILTGGESLSFYLAEETSLYERVMTVPVPALSFREHRKILGEITLAEYLQRGGFLRVDSPGLSEGAAAYVDTALCQNIRKSLERCQGGIRLRLLEGLHQAGTLDWAIRRCLERFCLDHMPVTQEFQEFLSLRELEEWSGGLGAGQMAQIKETLKCIGAITTRPTQFLDAPGEEALCFPMPGLFQSLARSLLENPEPVQTRLLSDVILMETRQALEQKYDVFRVQAMSGAFDLVIRSRKEGQCAVYTVSTDPQAPDLSALTNSELLERTARRFGPIVGKCVLYPGPTLDGPFGIVFQNAEEFLLKNL